MVLYIIFETIEPTPIPILFYNKIVSMYNIPTYYIVQLYVFTDHMRLTFKVKIRKAVISILMFKKYFRIFLIF